MKIKNVKWNGVRVNLVTTGGNAVPLEYKDGKFYHNNKALRGLTKTQAVVAVFLQDGKALVEEPLAGHPVQVQTSVSGALTAPLEALAELIDKGQGAFVAVRIKRDGPAAKAGDVAFQVALPFLGHIVSEADARTAADAAFLEWLGEPSGSKQKDEELPY